MPRWIAMAAAVMTALALTMFSVPSAYAAPTVTLASSTDWQSIIAAANGGETVEAELEGDLVVSGAHLLSAGTVTIQLNGFLLEVEPPIPGAVGFEIEAGALLHLVGPGTAAFRGGDGADGTDGPSGQSGPNGVDGLPGSVGIHNGEPGGAGFDGDSGGAGDDGQDGGIGFINAGTVIATGSVNVTFAGGLGGAGGAGGNGGDGGDGGNGGDAFDDSGFPGPGGDAGNPGDGAPGGDGGDGGDGYTGSGLVTSDWDSQFGSFEAPGGVGGAAGASGIPGEPGEGGWSEDHSVQAVPGVAGDPGADGDAGDDGASGNYGNVDPRVYFINGELPDAYDDAAMQASCGATLEEYAGYLERAGISFPVRDGYDFAGWAQVIDANNDADVNGFAPTVDDVAAGDSPICATFGVVYITAWKAVWVEQSSGNGGGSGTTPVGGGDTLANTGGPATPGLFGAGAVLLTAAGAILLAIRRSPIRGLGVHQ